VVGCRNGTGSQRKTAVDFAEIRNHFERHDLLEKFDELCKILDTTGS